MTDTNILGALFTEATVGIIITNSRGIITKVNPFCEALFEYKKNELIGQKIEILLPKKSRKKHVDYRNKYISNPEPRSMGNNLELFGVRKSGIEFPVVVSLSYTTINNETIAIAYVSDDSVKINLLNNLQESEIRLEESQRLASLGSFEIDFAKDIVIWSKEMYRIHGLEQNQKSMSTKEIFDFVHPEDLSRVKSNYQKIIDDKKGIDFSYKIVTAKNEIKTLIGKREVIIGNDGSVVKIYGSLQDITELEEVKSKSQDVFNIVEESLNEVYIFNGQLDSFLLVNRGARNNTGYTSTEIKCIKPLDIFDLNDYDVFQKLLLPLTLKKVEKVIFETKNKRKNGTQYPVEIHFQFSKLGNDDVFVAFVLDITERKNAEQKLLDYSENLELKIEERTNELLLNESKLKIALEKEKELGELKSRFVSMASHEFRTPLSTILSSASLIQKYTSTEQDPKRVKHVERIKSSVRNLTAILNDFLSLEKLESGKTSKHESSEIQLIEFFNQIIDEVAITSKPHRKIIFNHSGSQKVYTDEILLRNILINLISNGLKYSSDESELIINSKIEKKLLVVDIIDQGIGIPNNEKQHMFTRFFRATNASNIQGTGLGLTIVKRYLDLLEGTIHFESFEGVGTTFTIELPIDLNQN